MTPINRADFLALLHHGPTAFPPQTYAVVRDKPTRLRVTEKVSFRGQTFTLPVHLEHIVFEQFVDFADVIIEGGLRLENCEFHKGLRLRDMQVKGAMSLRHTVLHNPEKKWLDFRRLRIEGLTDFTRVTAAVGIDISNSILGDDWHLHGFKGEAAIWKENEIPQRTPLDEKVYLRDEFLGKTINAEGVEVRKHVVANAFGEHRFDLTGKFDLRANIGGVVQFNYAKFNASFSGTALSMSSATVGGSVFFHNKTEVTGTIDLSANVGGQVAFLNATLNAGVAGTAVNMSAATVGQSVFFWDKTEVTGTINLRAKISGQVEFINVTLNAGTTGTAVEMETAAVGGLVLMREGTRILGNINFYKAQFHTGFFARLASTTKGFQQPKSNDSRELLIVGDIELSYAEVHGPLLFHGASIWGKITADHLHVRGDLDWCNSVIGPERPADTQREKLMLPFVKPNTQAAEELFRKDRGRPTLDALKKLLRGCTMPEDYELRNLLFNDPSTAKLMELLARVHTRQITPWTAIETERPDPANVADVGLQMKMATIEGHLWFQGTRLLSSVTLEDTCVVGELNMTNGYVAGNLGLRSTKVEGSIVGQSHDEQDNAPAVGVKGHVDLSYAKVGELDYGFAAASCATTPTYINLTGAEVGVLQLRGTLAEVDRHHDSRGLLVAEGLKFQHVKLDDNVLPATHIQPTWRDLVRHLVWLSVVVGVGVLAAYYQNLELGLAVTGYAMVCIAARFGWLTTLFLATASSTIVTYCCSCLTASLMLGMSFAIVVLAIVLEHTNFLFGPPRQPQHETPTTTERDRLAEFLTFVYGIYCRCVQVPRESAPVLNLLAWSYPFSRSLYIAVESWLRNAGDEGRADEAFLMRRRRETGTSQPAPAVLVEQAKDDPALKENWQPPSMAMRFLTGLFDFAMGFGVRWSRLAHLYLLFFLLNTGVFLNPRAVERPIAYQQPRFDTLKKDDLKQIKKRDKHEKNPWPANGGVPDKNEWTIANAAFMALRLQVPILTLGAENDWEPASRPIFGGEDEKDHNYYGDEDENDDEDKVEDKVKNDPGKSIVKSITYEEYASFMVVANFILIPLIIAGITRQMRK